MPQINNKPATQQFMEIMKYRNARKGKFITTTHNYSREEFNVDILAIIYRNFHEFEVRVNQHTGVTSIIL